LTLNIRFNCNPALINIETFELVLNFTVLKNIKYDLIIGRPDIILHNIWNRTLLSNSGGKHPTLTQTEVANESSQNTSLPTSLEKTMMQGNKHASPSSTGTKEGNVDHLISQTVQIDQFSRDQDSPKNHT
jgi:hypothetical protein